MKISLQQLEALSPRASQFVEPLNVAMERFEIGTPDRVEMFLAQVLYESDGLCRTRELWGPTPAQCEYEPPGRKAEELGNITSGDGHRFLGRGLIQLTGRANYRSCGRALYGDDRLLDEPELLERPQAACLSAAWFWHGHGLNQAADAGDFAAITRRINGGLSGYAGRMAWRARVRRVLRPPR
ncbi:MAG: glycoside hydrolase family 19 protein [Nevskia sp.]|nr:glycoside hydrolase family 19 protein [Nevskia sp.]